MWMPLLSSAAGTRSVGAGRSGSGAGAGGGKGGCEVHAGLCVAAGVGGMWHSLSGEGALWVGL